jgi:hypothetical protein
LKFGRTTIEVKDLESQSSRHKRNLNESPPKIVVEDVTDDKVSIAAVSVVTFTNASSNGKTLKRRWTLSTNEKTPGSRPLNRTFVHSL